MKNMRTTTVRLFFCWSTGKARLYSREDTRHPGPDQKIWIPVSLILSSSSNPVAPNEHLVELPAAFAQQLGLAPASNEKGS